MHRIAQVAFSGLSGASDVCASLAVVGRAAGVSQSVAFWGTEPVVEARLERCQRAGVATTTIAKQRGFFDFASQRAVGEWARKNSDASAFILHYPAALFAVRKALRSMTKRPPIVAIEHHPNVLKRPHEWLLSVLLLWRGDGVVYLTDAYRKDVARRLGPLFSLRRKHTTVIGNGIELDRYQVPAAEKPACEFRVGMSGRLAFAKDYPALLRAFAAFKSAAGAPDAWLEIAGDGPMRAELEAAAWRLGISERVRFLGMMPQADLIPRMRSWDVFVLSTHGETQPLALMEAMACGLPCVATAVAGVVDVVRDGENAFLVREGDVAQMSETLLALAKDPARRASLSSAAVEHARHEFSAGRMWKDFQSFIEQRSAAGSGS